MPDADLSPPLNAASRHIGVAGDDQLFAVMHWTVAVALVPEIGLGFARAGELLDAL